MRPIEPRLRSLAVLLFLASLIPWVWPGDSLWISDEPHVLGHALQHLNRGELPVHGLMGSLGTPYGPFAAWVYMLLLALSRDLAVLSWLHAVLFAGSTAFGVYWIAKKTPALRAWVGALAMLSIPLWVYSRSLWDNPFLVPLTALTVGALLSFEEKRTFARFSFVFVLACLIFLTHLMSAAFLAALAFWVLIRHGKWLWSQAWKLIPLLGIAFVFLLRPYLRWLFDSSVSGSKPIFSSPEAWGFPLLGGRYFGFWPMDFFFGESLPGWVGSSFWTGIAKALDLTLILAWIGIGVCVFSAWRSLKARELKTSLARLDLFSVSVLLAQILLCGLSKAHGPPHYYNAVWILNFYWIWRALSLPWRGAPFVAAGLVSLSSLNLGWVIWQIHAHGGTKGANFGTVASHQVEIAKKIHRLYPDHQVIYRFKNWETWGDAHIMIQDLYGLGRNPRESSKRVVVDYRHPSGPEAWLKLEEARN